MAITMVTGGARSGKSSFAQELALKEEALGKKVIYLATALVGDAEMRRRVELHRSSRPSRWLTLEEPYDLEGSVDTIAQENAVVLVDCLTVWLSNILLRALEKNNLSFDNNSWNGVGEGAEAYKSFKEAEQAIEMEIYSQVKGFLEKLGSEGKSAILVSNEVGWGVVPEHYLGRLFRDIAGRVNQQVAACCHNVYLVVSGIPLKLKENVTT